MLSLGDPSWRSTPSLHSSSAFFRPPLFFRHPSLRSPPPDPHFAARLLPLNSVQMEPVPSGNLPPGFDPSACRSVYVGNLHVSVTEALLAEVFQRIGPLEGCKLIKKEKSSYGFVDYHDWRSAAMAIMTLHGQQFFGQSIKVNWAYASGQREDTSGHPVCGKNCCSDARVMWDHKTGRSRGYGFVSFRNQQDAQSAINDLSGKWLGSRQIRCNWAVKGAGFSDDKQSGDNQNLVVLTNGSSSDGRQENINEDALENNPLYTTVFVGNLAHEVTQAELHRWFHMLGAGTVEEVRLQKDKGFGFVRYSSHEEASLAIKMANGRIICGKSIKCSWGNKPTPPGTSSNLLPPLVSSFPILNQGYSAANLLAYQRQFALSQAAAGSGQAMNQASGVHGAIGVYDGYTGNSSAQQMYYQ